MTIDAYDKIERAKKKYNSSEKGKAAINRYFSSEKGKEARKRYLNSEKGREALLRYYNSEKAKTARERRQALLKLFRRADKYLKENPGKTIEDFLKEINNESKNDNINSMGS
jgi:hypothetical protein